jgi:hypothetical protein
MYVYTRTEPGLLTVGFYDPKGNWIPESDHSNRHAAAERVAYLNGKAQHGPPPYQEQACTSTGATPT